MGLSSSQLLHQMLAPFPVVLVHSVLFVFGICTTTNKKSVAHLCRFGGDYLDYHTWYKSKYNTSPQPTVYRLHVNGHETTLEKNLFQSVSGIKVYFLTTAKATKHK